MCDVLTQGVTEVETWTTPIVVNEDLSHLDSVTREPVPGAQPEGRRRCLPLVAQNLGVGEAAVVVDDRVDEAVTHSTSLVLRTLVLVALDSAQDLPAATVGDATELLDVDVDQVARNVAFVAANLATGGSVDSLQTIKSESGEHPVHRRWRDAPAASMRYWT